MEGQKQNSFIRKSDFINELRQEEDSTNSLPEVQERKKSKLELEKNTKISQENNKQIFTLDIMDSSSFEQCLRQFNQAETRISQLNEEIKKLRDEKKSLETDAIRYICHHKLEDQQFMDRETQSMRIQLTTASSFAPLTLQNIREKLHEYFGDARDDEAERIYNFLRDSREKKQSIFLKRSQNK